MEDSLTKFRSSNRKPHIDLSLCVGLVAELLVGFVSVWSLINEKVTVVICGKAVPSHCKEQANIWKPILGLGTFSGLSSWSPRKSLVISLLPKTVANDSGRRISKARQRLSALTDAGDG